MYQKTSNFPSIALFTVSSLPQELTICLGGRCRPPRAGGTGHTVTSVPRAPELPQPFPASDRSASAPFPRLVRSSCPCRPLSDPWHWLFTGRTGPYYLPRLFPHPYSPAGHDAGLAASPGGAGPREVAATPKPSHYPRVHSYLLLLLKSAIAKQKPYRSSLKKKQNRP